MRTVLARAPIRLDLAGGWTDVPPFCEREGGACVNTAINRYTYVTVKAAPKGVVLSSADFGKTQSYDDIEALDYEGDLGLLAASVKLAAGALAPPCEVFARCDAPPGSGTGSSGSVGVALVGAVAAWGGRRLAPHEAAHLAWRAEREELAIGGGTQDQYVAAYGGTNFMIFQGGTVTVSPLALAPDTVADLEKRLVLCYTGISRVSGNIIDAVMGAYLEGREETVTALRTMRTLAHDLKQLMLRGDTAPLGELLGDNWRCQRALHPSVSSSAIERLFERAARAGANGGKALGAGGGGCLLFCCATDREHEVRAALTEAGAQVMDFGLAARGLEVWERL